jgi:GxxExxY protein
MEDTIKQLAEIVYTELGVGYSERVYHNAMEVLLRENGFKYETERIVPILFKEHVIGNVRADIVVENEIILELKAVSVLNTMMSHQLKTYLKHTGLKKGILINFTQSNDDNKLVLQHEFISHTTTSI